MLGVVWFLDPILLELLVVFRELLPPDREIDRLDIEGRDDWLALLELLRELCLLVELLEDDLDDDDLRPFLDANAGSAKITAPSIIISTNLRLNPNIFMIKPRISLIFDNMCQIAWKTAITILAKRPQFVKKIVIQNTSRAGNTPVSGGR